MNADRPAFAAMAEKYEALYTLRCLRDAATGDPDPQTADTLQALAAQHPGCLRELDRLDAAALAARRDAARAAAAGAPPPIWLTWIVAYHRLLSAVLHVKRDPSPAALSVARAMAAPWPLPDGFLARAAAPPRGRVSALVCALLAEGPAHPHSATQVAHLLFPPRR